MVEGGRAGGKLKKAMYIVMVAGPHRGYACPEVVYCLVLPAKKKMAVFIDAEQESARSSAYPARENIRTGHPTT